MHEFCISAFFLSSKALGRLTHQRELTISLWAHLPFAQERPASPCMSRWFPVCVYFEPVPGPVVFGQVHTLCYYPPAYFIIVLILQLGIWLLHFSDRLMEICHVLVCMFFSLCTLNTQQAPSSLIFKFNIFSSFQDEQYLLNIEIIEYEIGNSIKLKQLGKDFC